jgi:hypothetical protein
MTSSKRKKKEDRNFIFHLEGKGGVAPMGQPLGVLDRIGFSGEVRSAERSSVFYSEVFLCRITSAQV